VTAGYIRIMVELLCIAIYSKASLSARARMFHGNEAKARSNMATSLVQQSTCMLLCKKWNRKQCNQCSAIEEYIRKYINYIVKGLEPRQGGDGKGEGISFAVATGF